VKDGLRLEARNKGESGIPWRVRKLGQEAKPTCEEPVAFPDKADKADKYSNQLSKKVIGDSEVKHCQESQPCQAAQGSTSDPDDEPEPDELFGGGNWDL